jgi:hypothetical protein
MNEELKHTSPPWVVSKGYEGEPERWAVWQDGDLQYLIAVIENGAPGDFLETEEANAHLCAAAPELLQACEWAVDLIEMYDQLLISLGERPDDVFSDTHVAGISKARAAIAKAKGEQIL